MFYAPIVKKLSYDPDFLVERVLPEEGQITVSVGEKVDPGSKLGTCKVVYEITELSNKFKVQKKEDGHNYYAEGEVVGSVGKDKFIAPYNGIYEETEDSKLFKAEIKNYWLMPGVWGEVKDISHNRSVLVSAQSVNAHVPVVSGPQFCGELIVFPNPSQMLAEQYFGNYIKSTSGKIVYVGNHLNMTLVKKAKELSVKALLAGSVSKAAYDFVQEHSISLGVFTGFGEINTPDMIYDFINDVTNRYVFFIPEKNTVKIPIPKDSGLEQGGSVSKILRYVRKGMVVQVLTSEHFGKMGTVDSATKSGIFVKLHDNNQEVEVIPPNFLIIE